MGLLDIFRRKPEPALATTIDVTEALYDGFGYDPDANHTAAQMGSAYVRRLTGQGRRDLSPLSQERARQIAFWLYDSNPMAKRVLEIVRDFIVGEGLQPTASGEEPSDRDPIQAVIDRFWTDPVNRLDLKVYDKALELHLWGEACYTVGVNPVDGHVRLGYIDPSDIAGVLCNPDNADDVQQIVVQAAGQGTDLIAESRRYKVIHVDETPGSEWYGRMRGVETDGLGNVTEGYRAGVVAQAADESGRLVETYRDGDEEKPFAGACFFFAINKVTNARRGRSDLLALADWLDGYDQLLFNEIDRSLLMKSFIWDVLVNGADEAKIRKLQAELKTPPPGSLRIHNEQITWTAVSPDIREMDAKGIADLLLGVIATGIGLPKTWLNQTENTNRATAQEMGDPAYKRLGAAQKYFLFLLEQLVTFALDQAEIAGVLPKRPEVAGSRRPEPWAFSVNAPELRSKDLQAMGQTIQAVTQAIEIALTGEIIDLEVAQEVVASLMGQLGVEINLDAMRARLEAAKVDAEKQKADGPLAPYNGFAAGATRAN